MNTKNTKMYKNLEKALVEANENFWTSCNKTEEHKTRIVVEKILEKLVTAMKATSATFEKLYFKNFGLGSVYENTKIGKIDEFDVDIVLKLPKKVQPIMKQKKVAGFRQIKLNNFEKLADNDPELHRDMCKFVDRKNYLISEEFMKVFIQKNLDKAIGDYFPNTNVQIGDKYYTITNIQYIEPALTLYLEGPDLQVSVDLVASFLLNYKLWPKNHCRKNPCTFLKELFLTPARPIENHPTKERFWRLSFHVQEKQIMYNRYWLKPTFRVLKKIRNNFNQAVHSYALKTLFLWELVNKNSTPDFWKSPQSFLVIYMLEKYLRCLSTGYIPYFWDYRLNLLSYLSAEQIKIYEKDIEDMLQDIKTNPQPETLLKYLK